MKTYVYLLLLLGMSLPCHAEWRERRGALQEMHQAGEFRIFYSLSGRDALRNVKDSDSNGVPDYVERIATDLRVARDLYEHDMHLRHPLRSPRYNNEADFIDVNLLGFPLTSNGPKYGIAYDELSSFDRYRDKARKKVLVMDISNDLPPGNRTPAHELFHLYQNGYTFFKNRWFTEGTARWAEHINKKDAGRSGCLPRSLSDVQGLFHETYGAAPFWSVVAAGVDPAGGGRSFIKAFLEELDRMDDVVGVERGMAAKWSEQEQMSRANDVHIWRAVQSTLEQPPFRARWNEHMQRMIELRL